jgi:hypothetical protein
MEIECEECQRSFDGCEHMSVEPHDVGGLERLRAEADALRGERERVTGERDALRRETLVLRKQLEGAERLIPCQTHRDKGAGRCIACVIENRAERSEDEAARMVEALAALTAQRDAARGALRQAFIPLEALRLTECERQDSVLAPSVRDGIRDAVEAIYAALAATKPEEEK